MAWPDTADTVIATAATQTANLMAMIDDIKSGADWAELVHVHTRVTQTDGGEPPVPTHYELQVTFKFGGEVTAAVAEKMKEVEAALGD